MSDHPLGTVLVVDDSRDIGDLVEQVLTDEGFAVSLLYDGSSETLRAAVADIEPDCILLDGGSLLGYGASWADAAWLAARPRAVPVIMFTAHAAAIHEATQATSRRSMAAGFAGVLPKPFDLDRLIATVSRAARAAR